MTIRVIGREHPDDVEYAARVDLFDFAMELHHRNGHLELRPTTVQRQAR